MKVITPAHSLGVVDIEVVNQRGISAQLTNSFSYQSPLGAPPSIDEIQPQVGASTGGTYCILTGSGFSPDVQVLFGTEAADVQWISDTQLTLLAPANTAGNTQIVVINPDGQTFTLSDSFTYIPILDDTASPEIFGLTPDTSIEAGGGLMTISGSHFLATPMVFIGITPALNVTLLSDGLLQFTAPALPAGEYPITVVNPNGLSITLDQPLIYTERPTILSVNPEVSPANGGAQLNISGTGFQDGADVLFDGISAEAVTWLSAAKPCDLSLIHI